MLSSFSAILGLFIFRAGGLFHGIIFITLIVLVEISVGIDSVRKTTASDDLPILRALDSEPPCQVPYSPLDTGGRLSPVNPCLLDSDFSVLLDGCKRQLSL